nr:hypothetical protein [Nitrospirota bacterium]
MIMRMLTRRSLIIIVFGLIAFLSYEWSLLAPKADAIPAFARKYNFACNVCHVPGFPKLNDFGNLFRDHGYQLGAESDLPEHESINMGYWPVSLRTQVGYRSLTYGPPGANGGEVSTGSFGFKTLNLLSYGVLAKDVSYGLIYAPALNSGNYGSSPTGGDLPNAFVRFNNLQRFLGGDANSYLMNFKVGKYEAELPFSAFRNPTQFNTPIVMYNYRAGAPYASANFPSNSRVSSGYGDATMSSLQQGLNGAELAGIKPTSLTNGYFRYSLNAFSTTGPFGNNGGRNMVFYGHATQSFDGYGIVSGHRIGISWWHGDSPTTANGLTTTQGTSGNGKTFDRVALDASTTFDGQWNLFGSIIHANDSKDLITNTAGQGHRQDAVWNGGFAELDWSPNQLPFFGTPGWMLLYRYDLIRNEQQGLRSFQGNYNNVDSHTWMTRYYIHQSARTDVAWHTEYNWFRTRATGTNGRDTVGQLIFTGIDFAL